MVIIAFLPIIACIGYSVLPVISYSQKKYVTLSIPVYLPKNYEKHNKKINKSNIISDQSMLLILDNTGSFLTNLNHFPHSEKYYFFPHRYGKPSVELIIKKLNKLKKKSDNKLIIYPDKFWPVSLTIKLIDEIKNSTKFKNIILSSGIL